MAGIINPGDNAVINYLQHWSGTFKLHYIDKVADLTRRFSKVARMIPDATERLNGNIMEFEFLARPNNGVRATYDLLAPKPPPAPGQYGRFQVKFNAEDPNNNDFIKLDIGFRLTWYDIQKRNDSNWKESPADFIQRDVEQGIAGVKEEYCRSFHLPTDGSLGTIATSGKRNADSDLFAATTTYTTGAAICMLKLDATAMQRIGDGQRIEIRTSAGVLRANNLIVERVGWGDLSLAVRIATSSHSPGPSVDQAGNPVTNFDNVIATDKLYINGNYNVIPKLNLASYFTPSTAFFGKARLTDENYRMLLPNRRAADDSGGTGSPVDLNPDMIHDMGRELAWTMGDGNAQFRHIMCMNYDQYKAMSRFGKDEGITMTPALQAQVPGDWIRKFGFDGVVFHDPVLGSVLIQVDDFAATNVIDFLDLSHWRYAAPFGNGSFDMMPGNSGYGYWSQNSENDGSGEPSLIYSARGMQHYCFVPTHPRKDGRLFNLKTPV